MDPECGADTNIDGGCVYVGPATQQSIDSPARPCILYIILYVLKQNNCVTT